MKYLVEIFDGKSVRPMLVSKEELAKLRPSLEQVDLAGAKTKPQAPKKTYAHTAITEKAKLPQRAAIRRS